MATITMEDLIESNRLKKEASDNIRKDLIESNLYDTDTIDKIIKVFETTAAGYTFSRKGKC